MTTNQRSPRKPTKAARLRQLIESEDTRFLMEAHSGLSAMVAEEAGFEGIWASGLSISAMLGVRDANEASWTQVLEVVEFMSDATSIPILLDGDTGYGNFNSVRRLVKKLEQRNVAGVCLEDKLFPKTNSFLGAQPQELADISEFCGKIRAAKDTQNDSDFVVIARVEALIAHRSLDEALERADAYRNAGADAILIHSARPNASEILSFKQSWGDRLPIVIVPTKYYRTPTQVFRDAGISLVIFANHLMRASLTSMQKVARQLSLEKSLVGVEPEVAPLNDVFRLQKVAELEHAEARYLPSQPDANAPIVSALSA